MRVRHKAETPHEEGRQARLRLVDGSAKWVSNHRSNEAGGPPADGLPRHKKPAVGDLLIYFVFCPCAVGYFLWVSAPACWAALYAHVLAPVGGFVHDHLLVPLGKCLGACWDLLARACTALYKHVLVPIGTAVAAGAAAMGKCLGACWDLLARACTAFYKHVLVPIGTARGRGGGRAATCWCRSGPLSRPGRRRWTSASARARTSWRAPALAL